MPIEIKELIIRAEVSGVGGNASPQSGTTKGPATEEVVMESMDQLMDLINHKKER